MEQIKLIEKSLSTGIFQFTFPFQLISGSEQDLIFFLEKHHFRAFQIEQLENEKAFYGSYFVSHRDMEEYFLPFTHKILFPLVEDKKGFQRYSKALNLKAILSAKNVTMPFQLHSIDLTICPYEIGFLTFRTEITDSTLSKAIEFAACFHVSEAMTEKEINMEWDRKASLDVDNFKTETMISGLMNFFDMEGLSINKGEKYVQSLLSFNEGETIGPVDVYRSGNLNGLGVDGHPYVNANNLEYIKRQVKKNSYDRYAPNTFYYVEEHCFTCLTNEKNEKVTYLASRSFGEFYYSLLLHLFHKLVFLKIANEYSKLNIEYDTKEIENLNYTINSFTSNYYFVVMPSLAQDKELFNLLRNSFNIDLWYDNTRETLFSLFKYEENTVTKRDSLLLLILTIYTIVCGIFSINLFTDDLKGSIHLGHFKSYNPFEYFAVFLVFSGLIVAIVLAIQSLYQGILDRKSRKRWVKQTVPLSKRQ